MILPILFLLSQDVFSSGDKPSSQPLRNPCKELRQSGGCQTIYYNPNVTNGQIDAMRQCDRYIKSCPVKNGGCDCWTMPDRPLDTTPRNAPKQTTKLPIPIPQPQNKPQPPQQTQQPPGDVYAGHYSPNPPPGTPIYPADIRPNLKTAITQGKCRTYLHNGTQTYLHCPGYIPDFVNDRLQNDPDAPDPKPSPIKLYGTITNSDGPAPNTSEKGKGTPSKFGVGNIDEADPPLLVTAKMLEGIDDCLKENLGNDIAMLPLNYAAQRYRGLKSIMTAYGVIGGAGTLVHDLQETLAPGQSLADRSYEIGRLLCEGYSLNESLNGVGPSGHAADSPGLDAIRPVNKPPIRRPAGPKPTPTYKDPTVKAALDRGITLEDHKALGGLAQSNGWNIAIRDSNPQALRWIGHPNAVAKPVDVKAKTLKAPTKDQLNRMTPAEKAAEAQKAPYYGLATAQGMTSGDLSLLRLKGYKVDDPGQGYVLRTPEGKVMYSDIDIHGIYDKAGNDVWPDTKAGEAAMIDRLNGTTVERAFEHGPQDHYTRRNDPRGPSYGPQPPVTIYTHDGKTIFVDSVQKLESTYRELGIAWEKIYPLPASQYAKP